MDDLSWLYLSWTLKIIQIKSCLVMKVTDFMFILLSMLSSLFLWIAENWGLHFTTIRLKETHEHWSSLIYHCMLFALIVIPDRWTQPTAQNKKRVTSFLMNVLSINILHFFPTTHMEWKKHLPSERSTHLS